MSATLLKNPYRPSLLFALILKEHNLASKDKTIPSSKISKTQFKITLNAIYSYIEEGDKNKLKEVWDPERPHAAIDDAQLVRLMGVIATEDTIATRFDAVTSINSILNQMSEGETDMLRNKLKEFDSSRSMDIEVRDEDPNVPLGRGVKRHKESERASESSIESSVDETDYSGYDSQTKAILLQMKKNDNKSSKRFRKMEKKQLKLSDELKEELNLLEEKTAKSIIGIQDSVKVVTKNITSLEDFTKNNLNRIDTEIKELRLEFEPLEDVEYMEFRQRVIDCRRITKSYEGALELLAPEAIIKEHLTEQSEDDDSSGFNFSTTKIKLFLEEHSKLTIKGKISVTGKEFKINDHKYVIPLLFTKPDMVRDLLAVRKNFKTNATDPKKNASLGRKLPEELRMPFGKLLEAKKQKRFDEVLVTKAGIICVSKGDERRSVLDKYEALYLAKLETIDEGLLTNLKEGKMFVNTRLKLVKMKEKKAKINEMND